MGTARHSRHSKGEVLKDLPYYDDQVNFTGVLDLRDERIWPDLLQTGALVLSEGTLSNVGGTDHIKLTANGSGITVPGAWKNIGSDAISPTNNDVNFITWMKVPSGIVYTNKLNP